MTGIELWSTTAASNNSAVPNGWPEGMAPSGVNDSGRQMMAAIRSWYEAAEWINFGHTPTYIGATQFSVTTDRTTTYQVGRRIKATGTTPFTIYGTISASVYASVTTVTVVWDSGSLNSTLNAVYVGLLSVTNPSGPVAPFIDSTAIIKGSADPTKLLRIEVDGFTTATTRTLTAPNFDGTIATLAGTEAFTNKTLTAPILAGTTDLTGGQIKFPASQSASADVNTLDDYEEGTWTPTLTAVTPGDLSVAYTTRVGTYTKIGRLVTVSLIILTSTFTRTTASGNALVTGLPFTSASGQRWVGAALWGGITKASYTNLVMHLDAGQTQLELRMSGSGQAISNVAITEMPSAGTVAITATLTYEV